MTTATRTFSVAAIQSGTVIDHIDAGHAMKIVKLLRLASHNKQVTLGLNLPSSTLECKDIIKVEDRELTPEEASQVAIFAPRATINIIKEYEVQSKFKVSMPASIADVIPCPNPRCVTNHDSTPSLLHVLQKIRNHISLQCHYCRRVFTHNEVR